MRATGGGGFVVLGAQERRVHGERSQEGGVSVSEIEGYDKITLLNYMLMRYVGWGKEYPWIAGRGTVSEEKGE